MAEREEGRKTTLVKACPAGTCLPTGTTAALLQAVSGTETSPSYRPNCGTPAPSEQLHPKARPFDVAPPASSHVGIRAGVSQKLPEGHGLQTTLAHRAERYFSHTWNFSFPSLKSRSWCCRCRLSPYKCPRSTCQKSTASRLLRKTIRAPVPLLSPRMPPAPAPLTPCPSALVKPRPIFPDVLKNWWVKCWAKKANIRLVPWGSASNFCRSRNLSARS